MNDFKDFIIEGEEYNLEWSYSGEGSSGDYNHEDPEDKPLIRLCLMDKNNEPIDSCSYCTQIEIDVTPEEVKLISQKVFYKIKNDGKTPKKIMEEVSWFSRNTAY